MHAGLSSSPTKELVSRVRSVHIAEAGETTNGSSSGSRTQVKRQMSSPSVGQHAAGYRSAHYQSTGSLLSDTNSSNSASPAPSPSPTQLQQQQQESQQHGILYIIFIFSFKNINSLELKIHFTHYVLCYKVRRTVVRRIRTPEGGEVPCQMEFRQQIR